MRDPPKNPVTCASARFVTFLNAACRAYTTLRDNETVRRFFPILLLPLVLAADDHWTSFSSGPFEVFTNGAAKPARETLVRFEELRHALGQLTGDDNLAAPNPIRIFLFKSARDAAAYAAGTPIVQARDRYAILLTAGSPVPASVNRETTRLLLESNTARMPAPIERGLLTLFSTIDVSGIRITLGRPVPAAERTHDWALVDMLATETEYYGKLRVIIYNLRRGIDPEAAYRNAVAKSPAEIARLADEFLKAGNFQTTTVSSRPLAERDFPEKAVDSAAARLALADLLIGDTSRQAYERMVAEKTNVGEAEEGLGLLALRSNQKEAARTHFAKAMEANSQSPAAYIEYARLEPDKAKAMAALDKAAKINPKLAEPHILMAGRESDLDRRITHLQAAVKLDPRNASWWQQLAESYLAVHSYGEAAKAWRQAEQAATEDKDRERYRQARVAIEQQRLDYEAAERKREQAEKERELERLKAEARAQLRAVEAKANQGSKAAAADKPVPWWDGPKPPGSARGTLKQIDCVGRQIRLIVDTEDNKTIRLLIPDPQQVAIMGGGEQTLNCGRQQARRVVIEYFPKANARLATAGEVATIEFQ
jgi:tetratricopeptide (TPR) repeat protein